MIGVLTDSTCDLPSELCKANNIHVIPMHVFCGEQEFLDGVTIANNQFYSLLSGDEDKHPRTEPPSVDDFVNKYEEMAVEYDQIISIHVSSMVSATCKHAEEAVRRGKLQFFNKRFRAKKGFKEFGIHIVDSRSVSIGNGFLALIAAHMVKRGAAAEEIVQRLQVLAPRLNVLLAPKNMIFLRRSKRVGAFKFLIANLLGISPVLSFQDGNMDMYESVRGVDHAVDVMVDGIQNEIDLASSSIVGIAWSGTLKDDPIRKCTRAVRGQEVVEAQFVSQIGATITSHTGPETLAVAYIKKGTTS